MLTVLILAKHLNFSCHVLLCKMTEWIILFLLKWVNNTCLQMNIYFPPVGYQINLKDTDMKCTQTRHSKWENMQTPNRFALCSSWSCYPTLVSRHRQPHDTATASIWEGGGGGGHDCVCHHTAHHVPVELLLCEPQGQCAPPAPGHCSNAMGVYGTWGEAHQSTAAGFYSSL